MKRTLAFLATLLFSVSAFAATVNLAWTNPTTYSDGSTLNVTDITQTRIAYGSCNADGSFNVQAGQFIVQGDGAAATSPNLAPGTYCFQAYTTAQGVESIGSNVATAVLTQPAPNPPILATVAKVAYAPVSVLGMKFAMAVGTVPLHTACTSTMLKAVNMRVPLHEIPLSAVKPYHKPFTPSGVYAQCG